MNTQLRTESTALTTFASEIPLPTGRTQFAIPVATCPKGVLTMDAVMLRAKSRPWIRRILVISWCSFLIVTHSLAPNSKLVACFLAVAMLGTYRETFISKSCVTWKFRLAFLPFGTWTHSLQGAQCVTSEWEEHGGMIEALLLGLWGWVLAPMVDWLCPWRGGLYKLWIKDDQGRKVLVWRGRSEGAFHSNHRLIQTVTELPVQKGKLEG